MAPKPRPMVERFWEKVEKTAGCWHWRAATNLPAGGYGLFWASASRPNALAHRVAYELLVGPIPVGLTLDHLCRNPSCVNPAHLEPVTFGENTRRGVSITAQNARKTHCKRGHPFSGSNLHLSPDGWRICRTCNRIAARRRRLLRSTG